MVNQLKELISIYSLQNTLCVLSFNKSEEQAIYTSIALSIAQMLELKACHIYLEKNKKLELVGTTGEVEKHLSLDETTTVGKAFISGETVVENCVAVPMHCNIKSIGVIVLENDMPINKEYVELVESIAILLQHQ